jgi:protein translocase SecG subunit
MLLTLLYIIFFLSCIVLVATVLLQPGKADAGALFTSSVSSTAFGARGTQTILSKITIGAASLFFLCALLISMPALQGNVSVLQTGSGTTDSNTNTNAATDANANVSANTSDANAGNTNAVSTNSANAAVNSVSNTTSNTNTAVVEKKDDKKPEEKKP